MLSLSALALALALVSPAHAGNASVRVRGDGDALVAVSISASDLLAVWADDNLLVRMGHGRTARWTEVAGPEDGTVDLGLTLPGSVVGIEADTVYVGFESMESWPTAKAAMVGLDFGQMAGGIRTSVTGFRVEIDGGTAAALGMNPETTVTATIEDEDSCSGVVSFPATDAAFWSSGDLSGVGMFAGNVGDMTEI